MSASCHSARAVLCRPIFDCLSFEIQIGLYWPVGSEGPSNVEKQIQENSNYFVILSSRMKPKSTKIIRKDYENNVTYRVQLFEKIFILWDNSSSITVQFGEYCCQSKMYKSGICGESVHWDSQVYLLELCLFLFTNKFANIFLRIPGKSNVLSHTRPFNSKIKKNILIYYSNDLNYFSWI